MSEIYRNNSQHIYLDIAGDGADATPTVIVTTPIGSRTLTVTSEQPLNGYAERWFVVLGIADTQLEGHIKVVWNLTIGGVPVLKEDVFDVVTPYVSMSELNSILAGSDRDPQTVESAVRHIINAHCGQSFGKSTKSLVVEAHGEDTLQLPERLIALTGISTLAANLEPRGVIVSGNGFYLKKKWLDEVSPIVNDNLYWGESSHGGNIIVAPSASNRPTAWRSDYPFTVTGVWGYESVPEPVHQAALLLVNDYGCNEIIYRDRYLESLKAADWRFQFSSRAWENTGNVRADQLLSQYVLLNWAVV